MKINIRGFTLVELMVTVAIIGILASIAYPNYIENVRSAKRAEAQGALVSFANAMEQWELQNGSYLGADDGAGNPTIFSRQVPINNGATPTYNLTISNMDPLGATYILRATPTDPAEGWLELDSAGLKTCQLPADCRNGTSW